MKRLMSAVLAASLMFAPVTALAESLDGGSWKVWYGTDSVMHDDYSAEEYISRVSGLQPGDDITFVMNLTHENAKAADWYMSNTVIKSLEERTAENSAYGYQLVYTGPAQSRTLFDSEHVGGEEADGLFGATEGLEDYLFLENLSQGQTAKLTLKVTLDGETETNAYFNTLARLKMQSAVDPDTEPTTTTTNKKTTTTTSRALVKTGDEQRLFPFYVAMTVSGVLFLALAVQSVRLRRQEDGEEDEL